MTEPTYKQLMKKLQAPFPYDDIEWRIQSSGYSTQRKKPWGKVLCYITARAVQDRLDTVIGIHKWESNIRAVSFKAQEGFICDLILNIDGNVVSKSDGAPLTAFEAFKGGISDSYKRTAVQFGVGRYLYKLGENWALFYDKGIYRAKIKVDGKDKWFPWSPPKLPTWALPTGDAKQPEYEKHVFGEGAESENHEDADELSTTDKQMIAQIAQKFGTDAGDGMSDMLDENKVNLANVSHYLKQMRTRFNKRNEDYNEWTSEEREVMKRHGAKVKVT